MKFLYIFIKILRFKRALLCVTNAARTIFPFPVQTEILRFHPILLCRGISWSTFFPFLDFEPYRPPHLPSHIIRVILIFLSQPDYLHSQILKKVD